MSLFDTLAPVDENKNKLSVSLSQYGLMFTKPLLKAMKYPKSVKIAIDEKRKLFGIKQSDSGVRFCQSGDDPYVRWNAKDIVGLLQSWVELPKGRTLKAFGEIDSSDNSVVFDFNHVQVLEKRKGK